MGRASLVGVLLLATGVAAAFWIDRVHFDEPLYTPIGAVDLVRHALPSTIYIQERLAAGELALWNPHQLAGQPFVGLHITGALYPPTLLALSLFEPARAIEVLSVLHLALAGAFTWLLAARFGLGAPARAVAALGSMFAGPLLFDIYQLPCLLAHAWLPAIVWAVHGLVCELRRRFAVALAASLALCFLAGYAQGFYYAVLIGAAFGLYGLLRLTPAGGRLRAVALAALAGALALALVAPQLLPAIELVRESVRGFAGLPYQQAAYPFAEPAWLAGGLLGPFAPSFPGWEWAPLRWRIALPLATLPLVAAGLLAHGKRELWCFLLAASVVAALYMLGPFTPVFGLAYALPLGAVFRGPLRLGYGYVFLVSLLAAIGVDGIIERVRRAGRPAALVHALAALLVLAVAADHYARSRLDVAHPAASDPIRGGPAALIDYLRARPGRERVFIQSSGPYRAEFLEKVGMMNGIYAVPDYESNMPAVYGRFLDGTPRRQFHGDTTLLEDVVPGAAVVAPHRLDQLSVRYYAVLPPGPEGLAERVGALAGGAAVVADGVVVFERPGALPRAYAVRRVVYQPSVAAALAHSARESFEPAREAVLESTGPRPLGEAAPPSDGDDAAEIVAYQAEEVRIAARCGADCLLVLTDLHYPGWRVEVDGAAQTIERVNGIFRGVWLAPGAHEIVYRYQPESFRLGLFILAAGSLAAGLALWRLGPRTPG